MTVRIPPIQCLLSFEALARLRSVTQTAEELFVTPSAVSHRIKQLEQMVGTPLFGRSDFSLTVEGSEYLAHVREGLSNLQRFPGQTPSLGRSKLRLAAPPTFARTILLPRLGQFHEAYPEIDVTIQVSIPLLDVVAEDADLIVRFGTGRYADLESVCLFKDEIMPMASPLYVRDHGPFETIDDFRAAKLLRSPLEPWRTWFSAQNLDWPEPVEGSQFNDMGLLCDAAATGMGVALVRLKLAAPWIEQGTLVRLCNEDAFTKTSKSPHAHFLCLRSGVMVRPECNVFAQWLKNSLV